jgi:spore maturation protein CgeB
MCLGFLSKLNRDDYTYRCFEIPACGSLLLAERTPTLEKIFQENEEAVFFSSVEEMLEKVLWLRQHPEEITRIAAAGRKRVLTDGHSNYDRAQQFLRLVDKVYQERQS